MEGNNKAIKFNCRQQKRLDDIYNAAHRFIKVLLEEPYMEYNQHYAYEVTEAALAFLVGEGYEIRYPVIVDDGGMGHIEEICKMCDEDEYEDDAQFLGTDYMC